MRAFFPAGKSTLKYMSIWKINRNVLHDRNSNYKLENIIFAIVNERNLSKNDLHVKMSEKKVKQNYTFVIIFTLFSCS